MLDPKSLVRQYIERVWNQGDVDAFDAMVTPSYSYRIGGQPERDRIGFRQFLAMTRAAFPDWRVDVLDAVGEGNTVAVRWEGHVTHQGVFYGIPPTGKKLHVSGINLYRVVDGRIDWEWEQTDSLGMLQQLGVLPVSPSPAGPRSSE
jgi:steroid delta-isomerase-like uncharacterized protein